MTPSARLCCTACVGGAFVVLLLAGPGFSEMNKVAIAKVKSGELAEARASWWGFDPADSTEALQAAINSGAKRLVIENKGRPWIVRPLQLASDQEIFFEKGAVIEAKKGEFKGLGDSLFRIVLKKNVTLNGYGATLRMHRKDYDNPPYKKAEWRNVLTIMSSSNIKVYGLTLAESGGDGIYLGVAKRGVTDTDIHIKDVVCDGNYRQGISVISARNLLIENTVLKNTRGTPPQAGIDFEPNHSSEKLVNCIMRNCVSENNAGSGYFFYLPNLDGNSDPISVRFENCIARGTNSTAFAFVLSRPNAAGPARGLAEFVDCTFEGGNGPGISISQKPESGCRLRFARCTVRSPAKDNPSLPAILLKSGVEAAEAMGNIAFENCVIEDGTKRPMVKFDDWAGELRLKKVTGNLVFRRGGKETQQPITRKWLDSLLPGNIYKWFPKFDTKGLKFVPVFPELSKDEMVLRPFSLRSTGAYAIYANKGQQVSFSLRHLQVGKYSGRAMPLVAFSPSGKKIPIGKVEYQKEKTLEFTAPESGLYRIPFNCKANKVQMVASNAPACISGESGRIRFISATGDFFFYVPAGTKEFGVKIYGKGIEAVSAAIFSPSGEKVWEKPGITVPEQFVHQSEALVPGQAWRIRFEKPAGGVMEDFYVQLQGIPPFLSCNPKTLFKPAE